MTIPDSAISRASKIDPNISSAIPLVNFYRITYLSDGLRVKGYLAVPQKQGKYPCIIYNRGGNREFGKITDQYFLTYYATLCSKGYVVVASQYRGNDGGEGKEEFGGNDVNDILNLVPLLSNLSQTDTSRIGLLGESRGGMMTYLALTRLRNIKAAIVLSGSTDLIKLSERPYLDTAVFSPLIPNYKTNKIEVLKQRSAVYFADKINRATPILLLHGTADWRVPADQALSLANRFYELKQPFRLILYEGGQHSLEEHINDYPAQISNWFDSYLRDGKKYPNLEPHGN